jgi:hypothetical protein
MTPDLPIPAWVQMLGFAMAFLAAILVPIINGRIAAQAATRAARAVEAVAVKLNESDAKTAKKLDAIHFLVDGSLSEAKMQITKLEQRLFEEGLGAKPAADPLTRPGPRFPTPGPSAPIEHG